MTKPNYSLIVKHLLMSCLPLLAVFVIIAFVDLVIFKQSVSSIFSWCTIPFVIFTFPILEIINYLGAVKKAKKLSIDLWAEENQQGELVKHFAIPSSINNIVEALKQGSWKYKITDQKTTNSKTILSMKHYQLSSNARVLIELDNTGPNNTSVQIKTGTLKKTKWSLIFMAWASQLEQIEYFQNILLSQEELNKELSFIE